MKQAYRSQQIREQRLVTIGICNKILEEYMEQGYRLSLRQLYYQLVARDIIPNRIQEYQKLSQTMVIARMNGLTDWNAIEDRIRQPHLLYWVTGIEDAISDTVNHYRLNRQEEQPYHMEIWTEKDAVSNILKRVSNFYHIRLMVNRGYSSCSAMYHAAKRLSDGRPVQILYVGDHDPSGLDMLRDIRDRLEEFELENFGVVPVALTMAQIKQFDPPPNPAKITDPRAKWYIAEHGQASWELDALRPEKLEKIVEAAVKKYLNEELFDEMVLREADDKERLAKMVKDLDD